MSERRLGPGFASDIANDDRRRLTDVVYRKTVTAIGDEGKIAIQGDIIGMVLHPQAAGAVAIVGVVFIDIGQLGLQ